MRIIAKIVAGIVILGIVLYVGTCAVGVIASNRSAPKSPDMPDMAKAAYSVNIVNTGTLLLTNKYEQQGQVYILHGYWRLTGMKFIYSGKDIVLDEAVFGKIVVTRRSK